ncbi:hypothetical protein PsYK624_127140 [Phanerochaete sordida]|uniref:Cytochrome P450 n=1 Tax=Phanerochaete sordida TaxID=48140 RepID=A0A9P3GJ59_9APHY|nr:hypothetical protein PsYK624_127140 [Phanerochaete sordida]
MDSDVDSAIQDKAFKIVTATTISGGSDTVTGALVTFVLAMTMFPKTQAAAHAEIDRVVGRERVPEIEDRELLPYVTALFYEVTRWHPSGPIGLPHRLTTDDEYHGYHIPAGAVVIANIWAMLHDENVFPEPDKFMPERFLGADGALSSSAPRPDALWGFGRRICPGRHFATDFLWIAMVHILAVFRIEPAVGSDGQRDEPKARFSPHHISAPEPFRCEFKPRFPGAENMVNSVDTAD